MPGAHLRRPVRLPTLRSSDGVPLNVHGNPSRLFDVKAL